MIIEEEDSLDNYYSLLQQYKSLKKDVRDIICAPRYCLPFLQPGRLVSIHCSGNENSPAFSTDDLTTWGVIINFERVKGLSEGENHQYDFTYPNLSECYMPDEIFMTQMMQIKNQKMQIIP